MTTEYANFFSVTEKKKKVQSTPAISNTRYLELVLSGTKLSDPLAPIQAE